VRTDSGWLGRLNIEIVSECLDTAVIVAATFERFPSAISDHQSPVSGFGPLSISDPVFPQSSISAQRCSFSTAREAFPLLVQKRNLQALSFQDRPVIVKTWEQLAAVKREQIH
jgi:hypothetical protein